MIQTRQISNGITGAQAADVVNGNANISVQNELVQHPAIEWGDANTYISQGNGTIVTGAAGFYASEKIPLNFAKKIGLAPASYHQYALYNDLGVFIDTEFSADGKIFFDRPEDAHYIAISSRDTDLSKHRIILINEGLDKEKEQTKLYTADNVIKYVGYVQQTNGVVNGSTPDYSATDFIEVPSNILGVYVNGEYQQFAWFDVNGVFIPSGDTTETNKFYEKPAGARFGRFTIRNSDNTWYILFKTALDLMPTADNSVKTTTIRVTPDMGYNIIQQTIDGILDNSPTNRYIISAGPGVYKVTNSSQYNNPSYPAFIVPKDHVDIIGDNKEDVIVWAELPYNDGAIDTATDRNLHQTVYNWADDCLIKNITFVARNIRYVVHQDDGREANKTRRYDNCDFIFKGNKGSLVALGIGTWSGSETYIKNGVSISDTDRPVRIHNAVAQAKQTVWSFENHEFIDRTGAGECLVMQNSGSLIGDRVYLKDTSFSSGYKMLFTDWWINDPSKNKSPNHAEWRIFGSGNTPFYFNNTVDGQALKITAANIGDVVRFDKSSSAYNVLIKAEQKYLGYLGHPERVFLDREYLVQDFDNTFKSYAFGGLSIRETPYQFGAAVTGESLGQRLGNRTGAPITLRVTIGGTSHNILFNQNYTSLNNATIIASINAQLGAAGVASSHNMGLEYYPELTDVNLLSGVWSAAIPKGNFVTIIGGLCQIAQAGDEIAGVAFDDMQARVVTNGEIKGTGRVVRNCIMNVADLKVATGSTTNKGDRFKVVNGELVNDVSGKMYAVENGLIRIY